MNIYDFDGTIYDGDSSVDFFKYCIKRNKKCLTILPKFIVILSLYCIKLVNKEKLKSAFFSFIKYFDNIDIIVEDFWNSKNYKLKEFFIKQHKKNDIIISASPEFLLKPVAKKYNFNLIGTKMNKKTGKIIGSNCHGKEKVLRLKEKNIECCKAVYSDSLSDKPMQKIAEKAYLVKKDKVIEWEKYKPTRKEKFFKLFFNRDFVTFVFIGAINAFNGVWIAYVYSMFLKKAILAYILGFITSLCISYILNSLLNFKEKLNINKFLKFSINNIPNFIIQLLAVTVFLNVLKIPKFISYTISAIIAVPITFVLIKINVFNKEERMKKNFLNKIKKFNWYKLFTYIFMCLFILFPCSIILDNTQYLVFLCFLIPLLLIMLNYGNLKFLENKKTIFVIIGLSFIIRLIYLLIISPHVTQISDFGRVLSTANTMDFSNDIMYYQTSYHWLYYTILNGLLFKIFGYHQIVTLIFNLIIVTLIPIITYKVCYKIFNNRKVGNIAVMLYAFWPSNILYTVIATPEHLSSLFLVLSIYLCLLIFDKIKEKTIIKKWYLLIFAGIAISLIGFFKNFSPVILIALIIIFLLLIISEKISLKLSIISFLIIGCVFIVINKAVFAIGEKVIGEDIITNQLWIYAYVGLGLENDGSYSGERYMEYRQYLIDNNFDTKKTNKYFANKIINEIKDNLYEYPGLLTRKANYSFTTDDAQLYWVKESLKDDYLGNGVKKVIDSNIVRYNEIFYISIIILMLFSSILNIVYQKNNKLLFINIIIFGCCLLLMFAESQGRYKYAFEVLMLIMAANTLVNSKNILINNFKKLYSHENKKMCQ